MKDYFAIIFKMLVACLAYFAEIKNLFHAVLFFMIVDWITGVYASYKQRTKGSKPFPRPNQHVPHWFTSYKMRRTIEKFVFYMMAIAVSYVFRVEFLAGFYLGKIVAGYIALTELKSIFENISKIMGVDLFNEIWLIIKNKFFGHYQISDKKEEEK